MNAPFDLGVYKEALLFLATAGVVAPLFVRLRVSPVLGYLLAGVALGPFGLGRLAERTPILAALALTNVEAIARLAEFGVVVLLFTIGLELSFERVKRMRRLVFEFGLSQLVVSALALGLLAYALGRTAAAATTIGAALALSSTAIVIPVLAERKRLAAPVGRLSFAALLLQDLAVAPLLVLVTMLSGGGHSGNLAVSIAIALAPAAAALAAVIVVGRLVLRPLFHSVALTRSPEFFMAACMLVVLGAALTAAASGLSMALGAFVAGLLLAETEFRREIEVTIEPFKGLLLGLFFVSVGAQLDLSILAAAPIVTIGIAVAVIAIKALIVFVLGRLFKRAGPRRRRGGAAARPWRRIRLRRDRRRGRRRRRRPRRRGDPACRRRFVDDGDPLPRPPRRGAGAAARARARPRSPGRAARRGRRPRRHRRLRAGRNADRRNARRRTASASSPSTPIRI